MADSSLHAAAAAWTSGQEAKGRGHATRTIAAVPWAVIAFAGVWLALRVWLDPAQRGDNFEQLAWAHGIEWGYHKHPPLPTWLLAATIGVFGAHVQSASLLAAACTALTALFSYAIARRLLGTTWAALALLMWGLQVPFSNRVSLYNHNTVMLMCVAATVWLALHAAARPARTWRWLLVGIAAGAAMLSKYQAAVPLSGIVVALALGGDARRADVRRGLVVATLIALGMLVPHAAWVAEHDFTTLAYASQQGQALSANDMTRQVASFLAQQLRMIFPALLLGGLLVAVRGRREPDVAGPSSSDARRRAWLIGLVAWPFAITVLTGPLFGLALQNHWGYQCLQFASLFIADRLRGFVVAAGASWLVLAVAVHGVFVGIAWDAFDPPASGAPARRLDIRYPAQKLADAVMIDWRDATGCALKIVVGPTFEAGMVSVYSGGEARVLEDGDFRKSPWIGAADIERDGAVYVATDEARLPAHGVVTIGSIDVGDVSPHPQTRIWWAIVPPESCGANVGVD